MGIKVAFSSVKAWKWLDLGELKIQTFFVWYHLETEARDLITSCSVSASRTFLRSELWWWWRAWWWCWLWLWWCRWWWWWWWCQPSIPALRAGTEILLWYEKLPARRAQASQVLKEDNIMHSFSGTKYLQTLVWFTNHDNGPSICLFEPQLLVVYLGGRKILLSGFFPLKGGIAPYSARGKFQ